MALAFIFPGQGSQAVGMGQDLARAFPAARAVFEEVDDSLNQALSRLMWEGPEEDLRLTENAQPALMAVSLAVIRVLKQDFNIALNTARFTAGHSLGEYSALTAAGSLRLAETARLLKKRGQAMQNAVPVGQGAMAALLGADEDLAEQACEAGRRFGVCAIANDNAPGQIVLSGTAKAVETAAEAAREGGAKKAIMLPVSAPFHCSLMAPAADVMRDALATTDILTPNIPLIANVTASALDDPGKIREALITQTASRVRWRESILTMTDKGVTEFAEAGVGKVLTQMLKRTVKDVRGTSLHTPEELETFAKQHRG